ncbi:MAG: hypothetical protein OEM01_11930 [Desulfobulbaceae bacterium]|nr:hypothetical protein [Desulfobulbaceae bacterium]
MERLVILAEGDVLKIDDLPSSVRDSQSSALKETSRYQSTSSIIGEIIDRSPRSLEDIERHEVETALKRHGWVQARAARELGLTQRQIGYRIKKYGLTRPQMI